MSTEKYFIVDISSKKATSSTSETYKTLRESGVERLGLPFIPIHTPALSSTTTFGKFINNSPSSIQVALPHGIDHMKIFDLVKMVNDKLNVTLLGEQSKSQLAFRVDPERYGLMHFTLGEKIEGLE